MVNDWVGMISSAMPFTLSQHVITGGISMKEKLSFHLLLFLCTFLLSVFRELYSFIGAFFRLWLLIASLRRDSDSDVCFFFAFRILFAWLGQQNEQANVLCIWIAEEKAILSQQFGPMEKQWEKERKKIAQRNLNDISQNDLSNTLVSMLKRQHTRRYNKYALSTRIVSLANT